MIDQSAGALSAVHGRQGAVNPGRNPGDRVAPEWSEVSDLATAPPVTTRRFPHVRNHGLRGPA
ncbi:MAG: hypothetical protein WBV06_12520, partial [Acidimicrobiia bacterium]